MLHRTVTPSREGEPVSAPHLKVIEGNHEAPRRTRSAAQHLFTQLREQRRRDFSNEDLDIPAFLGARRVKGTLFSFIETDPRTLPPGDSSFKIQPSSRKEIFC
jgi:hypothetical protein